MSNLSVSFIPACGFLHVTDNIINIVSFRHNLYGCYVLTFCVAATAPYPIPPKFGHLLFQRLCKLIRVFKRNAYARHLFAVIIKMSMPKYFDELCYYNVCIITCHGYNTQIQIMTVYWDKTNTSFKTGSKIIISCDKLCYLVIKRTWKLRILN